MERGNYYCDDEQEVKKSYFTLYHISKFLPGCEKLLYSYEHILSPSYKDEWPELTNEIDEISKNAVNKWFKNDAPENILNVLNLIKQVPKLQPFLKTLRALAGTSNSIYFDTSENKAIPATLAIISPFFVLNKNDKDTGFQRTKVIIRGNTTLEISGLIMKDKDAQLLHALLILMRKNLEQITTDGVIFFTTVKDIALILGKSNPRDQVIQTAIKEGLKRLRGCVLTVSNDKGNWMIGGILTKASKWDEHDIRIVLDRDYLQMLDCGYVNLDPAIHLSKLSPSEANIYRYLMNDKQFKDTGTLTKREIRKFYESIGFGGIDPKKFTDSWIRFQLKEKFQSLRRKGIIKYFKMDKDFIWIHNEKKTEF